MNEHGRAAIALLFLLLALVGAIALTVWLRRRRSPVLHPGRAPRGRRLAAHSVVVGLFCGAITAYAWTQSWWDVVVPGVVSTTLLLWTTRRALTDPEHQA